MRGLGSFFLVEILNSEHECDADSVYTEHPSHMNEICSLKSSKGQKNLILTASRENP